MQLTNQIAMVKMAGAMQKSSDVMKAMGKLINAPGVATTMRQMAMEMEKVRARPFAACFQGSPTHTRARQAGIIDEVMQEATEDLDDSDIEEESAAEVDRIIAEITMGSVAAMGDAPRAEEAKATAVAGGAGGAAAEPEASKEEEDDLAARLGAL